MDYFSSNIVGRAPTLPPDIFEPIYRFNKIEKPSTQFVISRNSNGEIVSVYGDHQWDLSPYKSTIKSNKIIYFNRNMPENISSDLIDSYKWLVFAAIYLFKNGRSHLLSVSSIYSYSQQIRKMIIYCHSNDLTLEMLIENERSLFKYAKSANKNTLVMLVRLMSKLHDSDHKVTRFRPASIEALIKLLRKYEPRKFSTQTPVIPSRIYAELINFCHSQINEFIEVKDGIFSLIKKLCANKGYGRSYKSQYNLGLLAKDQNPNFSHAARLDNISDYCNKYEIDSAPKLCKQLRKIQYICKYILHTYTGMRDSEILSLMCDCLIIESTTVGKNFRIKGFTTKLTGTPRESKWVTSKDVIPAIDVAASISKLICECSNIKEHPLLFMSVGHLKCSPYHKPIAAISQNGYNDLDRSVIVIPIQEIDLIELEKISPFTNWRNNSDFMVGKIWPLTTHQLRRSLAVYAAQSGLISLPSLKRQLKHITREMTIYYASGSSNAKDLFGTEKAHFRNEYINERPIAGATAFIKDVVLSEERMIGVQARLIEKQKNTIDFTIIENREKILKKFRNGEIAYSETPMGACLSNSYCEKRAIKAITACLSCDKAIIKPNKLDEVIIAQNDLLDQLDKHSIAYHMENEQLKDLKRIRQQLGE